MDKVKDENLADQNIIKLKELFPAAFTEGEMIDFDVLKTLLGENVDERQEKYQFTWNGKRNNIRLTQTPSTGTLSPKISDSRNWDLTGNYYFEGDNLEVLKLLQKTYSDKIKVIYIDPPYNTGNDFVYKDNFTDNIKNYIEQTNQASKSNLETNGRFHTDWLNMMYSRLYLARNLLTSDGVIYISIDDNEIHNLRKITDEIFGENNFLATIIWERAYSPVNLKKHFSPNHDYALCYAKNLDKAVCNGLPRSSDADDRYSNPDNDERGVWKSSDLSVGPVIESKLYEVITPSGRKVFPPAGRCWSIDQVTFNEYVRDNRIWFGPDGNNVPSMKRFLTDVKNSITPMTLWRYTEVGHSQDAQKKLKKLFDDKAYFDYPKSIELVKRMIQLYSSKDSIIMDFFSGSSTTAHSVMQLNADDGGNRKFIMVQLPELTDEKSEAYKAGYKNICEIGQERIRRAGDLIVKELIEKKKSKGMLDDEYIDPDKLDIGFKVFKLESSNFIPFEGTREGIQASLDFETISKARSAKDVLYEIMLKYGVFDKSINEFKIEDKTIYSVGAGYLLVCLDKYITDQTVNEIAKLKPRTVIFDETGFKDDNAKDNAIYALLKAGVEEIKSI